MLIFLFLINTKLWSCAIKITTLVFFFVCTRVLENFNSKVKRLPSLYKVFCFWNGSCVQPRPGSCFWYLVASPPLSLAPPPPPPSLPSLMSYTCLPLLIRLPSWGKNGKEYTYNAGVLGSIPGLGRSLEEGMATHSSILAWRIPMDRGAWWATFHGVAKSQT